VIANRLELIATGSIPSRFPHTVPSMAALQLALCYRIGFGVTQDRVHASNILHQNSLTEANVKDQEDLIRSSYNRQKFKEGLFSQLLHEGLYITTKRRN
jgi:hypothetical protein